MIGFPAAVVRWIPAGTISNTRSVDHGSYSYVQTAYIQLHCIMPGNCTGRRCSTSQRVAIESASTAEYLISIST